jgi:hypothetical protein
MGSVCLREVSAPAWRSPDALTRKLGPLPGRATERLS